MRKFHAQACAVLVVVCLCAASMATAQTFPPKPVGGTEGATIFGPPHVSGIRATVTNVDVDTLTATIDVTEFYVTNAGWGPFGTGWIGVATSGLAPLFRAVEYGDGAPTVFGTSGAVGFPGYPGGVSSAGLPYVSVGTSGGSAVQTYRGTFVHTYPSEGNYTVVVRSVNGVGTSAGQAPPIVTGNLVSAASPTNGNNFFFLSNSATVDFPVPTPTIAIDTVSDLGLLLLALALAGSAVFLLRR